MGDWVGMSQVAASDAVVSSSPDLATLERVLATADGTVPSLAEVPALQAIATASGDDMHLIQATLLTTGLVTGLP